MSDAAAQHPFDAAIALEHVGPDLMRGATTPDYANMIGPFGGVTAAVFLRAVERHPDRIGSPLSLTVNYAAPVAEGEFDISVRAVRTNRSSQHWLLELGQGGVVAATATAVFGNRRDTWTDTEIMPPSAPPADVVERSQAMDFLAWTRNYDMRFVEGGIPTETDGEQPESTTTLWVGDHPARPLDFPSLAALCDVFYPRVFKRRGQAMPAGTVTLTVYFHADPEHLERQAEEPVLATAGARQYSRNYFDQTAEIWGRDGNLLAIGHQLVYFKG